MLHNQRNARSETPADKSNMQIITSISKGQTTKERHIFSDGVPGGNPKSEFWDRFTDRFWQKRDVILHVKSMGKIAHVVPINKFNLKICHWCELCELSPTSIPSNPHVHHVHPGAGGHWPPPVKVGGLAPHLWSRQKNQYFRHHKIGSLYGNLTLKYWKFSRLRRE